MHRKLLLKKMLISRNARKPILCIHADRIFSSWGGDKNLDSMKSKIRGQPCKNETQKHYFYSPSGHLAGMLTILQQGSLFSVYLMPLNCRK